MTFTIDDCTLQPQPDPVPLAIYGVTTLCLPGDATESAVWVVEQHGTVQPAWFEWTIRDDAMLSVDTDSPVTILDDQPTPLSSRALPLGTMHLTVTGVADPAVTASANVRHRSVHRPGGPGRPERQPTDPADSSEPDRRERSHELARTDPSPPTLDRAGGHDVDSHRPSSDATGRRPGCCRRPAEHRATALLSSKTHRIEIWVPDRPPSGRRAVRQAAAIRPRTSSSWPTW